MARTYFDSEMCELDEDAVQTMPGWVRVGGKIIAAKKLINGSIEYRYMGKTRTADELTHKTFSQDCE